MMLRSRKTSRAARRRLALELSRHIRPAEQRYVRGLRGLAQTWAAAYVKAAEPHLAQVVRVDGARFDVDTLANAISVLGIRVEVAIPKAVGQLFDRMAGEVRRGNARGMALIGIKPSDTGLEDAISKAREANIALVENAHRTYAAQVRDVFSDPDNAGLRVEDLKDLLVERGDVSESRAELIARDQTLKLNGALTQERQTSAGVSSYVWSTSLDDRVREEHAALEGQVFGWDSPPEPGHPGEDFQCRCVAIPNGIAELDDVFG